MAQGDGPLPHRQSPLLARRGQFDLAEDQIDNAVEQVLLVGHMVVQGHGLDPDGLAELAHAERLQTAGVGEVPTPPTARRDERRLARRHRPAAPRTAAVPVHRPAPGRLHLLRARRRAARSDLPHRRGHAPPRRGPCLPAHRDRRGRPTPPRRPRHGQAGAHNACRVTRRIDACTAPTCATCVTTAGPATAPGDRGKPAVRVHRRSVSRRRPLRSPAPTGRRCAAACR